MTSSKVLRNVIRNNLRDSIAFLNRDFESLAPPSGNQRSKQKWECNLQNRADSPLDMFVRIAKCYNLEIVLRILYFFRFLKVTLRIKTFIFHISLRRVRLYQLWNLFLVYFFIFNSPIEDICWISLFWVFWFSVWVILLNSSSLQLTAWQ